MKRKKKITALILTVVMLFTGFTFFYNGVEADTSEDDFVSFATVKSITDFRNYIDNNNPCSSQDVIETDWSGYSDVHKVQIPSDGKLLVANLAEGGYVDCELFTNFALTSELKKVGGTVSARENIESIDVKAGTYYYRGSRWNGTGSVTVTIYLGFIPSSSTGVMYSDTSVKFDKTNNVTPQAVTSKEDFIDCVNNDGAEVAQDTIETDWSGTSDTHSFTVEENGWLFVYPLAKEKHIDFQLYSNANLSSMIMTGQTLEGTVEEPYVCYLSAGTYYFRGNRWNGYNPLTFTTYLGFMKDTGRFAVTSNTVSDDKKSATITFSGENGLIRVEKGEYDPAVIEDEEFWKTKDRGNALEGTTATITSNGEYVARLETKDGCYVMIPFTVSGLIELPSPTPTVTPTITPKPTATVKPSPTVKPTTTAKVYKVKVAKKTITVKVKKSVKIKYTVTAGYKGKVKFTSSNKKIATVSSKGVVKGKKKGKCKVTLKLTNGKKAVVTVKVKK